ncbi:unnamed protein product [Cylicocyclus nassatus]|uniref:Uncharacterized protein n=1 Tax=Cylicocyclus nassatus TaxID=53992 RepID=A0AA36DPH2_CYLNA|nr:unnamed protein product [Cylicocyclus nassatus]
MLVSSLMPPSFGYPEPSNYIFFQNMQNITLALLVFAVAVSAFNVRKNFGDDELLVRVTRSNSSESNEGEELKQIKKTVEVEGSGEERPLHVHDVHRLKRSANDSSSSEEEKEKKVTLETTTEGSGEIVTAQVREAREAEEESSGEAPSTTISSVAEAIIASAEKNQTEAVVVKKESSEESKEEKKVEDLSGVKRMKRAADKSSSSEEEKEKKATSESTTEGSGLLSEFSTTTPLRLERDVDIKSGESSGEAPLNATVVAEEKEGLLRNMREVEGSGADV